MPKFKITKTFPFAHRGCDVVEYQAGTEVDTEDQALIDVLLQEKWGKKMPEARGNKTVSGAPDTLADGIEGDGLDQVSGGPDSDTEPEHDRTPPADPQAPSEIR